MVLDRIKRLVIPHSDKISQLRKEGKGMHPNEAYERIRLFMEKNAGMRIENEDPEEFIGNLQGATFAGTVSAGAIAAGRVLGGSGHETIAGFALKLGLSAIPVWLYYAWKSWKIGKSLHKMGYAHGYGAGLKITENLPPEVRKKLMRDAAVARDSIDPWKSGFARGLLHALLEVEANGTGKD